MGIFANFDIINSFQYGIDNVKSTRKAETANLKSLDALKDPSGRLGKDNQSLFAMQKVVSMHKAVESLRISTRQEEVMAASIASANDIELGATVSFTTLESTEEVNATSEEASISDPVKSATTTPVTVSGVYDGSNGSGQLTVEVLQGGTHGQDDLQLSVFDADNNLIQTISVSQSDDANQQYGLGNGLSISLDGGELLAGDSFGIDVTVDPSTYSSPTALSESTATASISGTYDGSNGSGQLTFEVVQGGIHGQDDLQLQVFDADNNAIQTISISQNDAIDQQYELGNGLSLSLSGGEILTGDQFGMNVTAGSNSHEAPTALTESTAAAGISGQYDGSNGSGQLTFEVIQGGVHGQDDLQLQVFDPNSNAIQTINIAGTDALDQQYDLGNGLSLTLGGGEILTGDQFAMDVTAGSNSYESPTPVTETTAAVSLNGTYDGSNGSGQLTVEVVQGGTHGQDDLQLQVFDPNNNAIQTINIAGTDAIGQQYDLGNGLSLTLGGGEILSGDKFGIDVVAGATDYSEPTELSASTAEASISGTYDGSDGSGELTFKVTGGGTHGQDHLRLEMYDTNGNLSEELFINKNHAINQEYDLGNGLSLTLGTGELLEGDTFGMQVGGTPSSYSDPTTPTTTTAAASVSGTYDGSNGAGDLTVEVVQGGTHGQDDLQLQVFDPNNNVIQTINIAGTDAIDQQYDLGNGLSLTLNAGEVLTGDSFTVGVNDGSHTHSSPSALSESTAQAGVSGTYDGSDGTGPLSAKVTQGGTHGQDDLQLEIYDANNNLTQTINIAGTDAIDQQYDLGNGLSLNLGAGNVLTGDQFAINVSGTEAAVGAPSDWGSSTASATIGGAYDGSTGTGTLTFEVTRAGTHGKDHLNIRMYDTAGNVVDDVFIRKQDALDKEYSLSNGLTLSLGAGDLVNGDTFTVDVVAAEAGTAEVDPWSGANAEFAVGGSYDGSNGSDTLTFEVTQGGTHGTDDLSVAVFDSNSNQIDTIAISSTDAIDQQYTLSNGLSLSLGAGNILEGSSFTVDVTDGDTSVSTPDPWAGASADFSVGGTYDGTNGDGSLTFEVTQGGVHGADELSVAVFDANNNQIDTIAIGSTDAIDQQYTLSNGLTLSLGTGNILEGSSFTVDVVAGNGSDGTPDPWSGSSAEFAIGGTYDGSNGSGTLTFEVTQGGIHGADDLSVAVFDANNNQIDTIAISSSDAIDQQYTLSNGLSLSLGGGNLLAGSQFTVEVTTDGNSASGPDPWEGASADFSVGGTYDGSNGSGTLTFEVTQGGIHGTDDLSVAVFDANSNQIDTIAISSSDAIDQQYTLSNGLSLSLGAGNILEGASFTMDVTAGANSSTVPDTWTGANAEFTLDGSYDGSNGSGTLTFEVTQGGTHGTDDLSVAVFDSNNNQIDTIAISSADAIDQQYTLSNGLSLSLGAGNLLEGSSFTVGVTAGENSATTPDPWTGANADFAVGGSYDGSNGSGTLTFEVTQGGTHGTDDLSVRVLDADNNEIETISINSSDAADQQYTLSNGLSLSLGEGNVLEGSRFSVDVVAGETTASAASTWTSSEAAITVGGAYDGSSGDDTLTFNVVQGGTHGTDALQLSLSDSAGNILETINVSAYDPLNQQYTLSNGLSLTLGEGAFVNNTKFSVNVSAGGDNAIDPTKAFNGTGADSANLEAGHSVTAGAFQVNGVNITVSADDSVNSVIDRINSSGAGVSASFDSSAEKMVLTQNTAGAEQNIVLANDTSGFLSAVKLDTAVATPGQLSGGVDSTMSDVAALAGVQSGTISINDIDISIDISSDSLQDVIDRINSSDTGVTASLDGDGDRISLTAYNNEAFSVDGGETNLFTALNINEGTHSPTVQKSNRGGFVGSAALALSKAVSRTYGGHKAKGADEPSADSEMMATMVNLTAESMNGLFDDSNFDNKPNATVKNVRKEIHSAISSAFKSGGPTLDTDVGLEIDFSKDRSKVMKVDQERIGHVLSGEGGAASMRTALFGNGIGSKGLLGHLDEGLNKALANLESQLGSSNGVFLDISA